MPRIPTYTIDAVDQAPLPGARQIGGASADMFFNDGGAGVAGKALATAGNAMFEIAAKEQKKVDEARVQDAYTQLAKATNESVYGANGVTSQLGSSAVGVADKWMVDYDKVTGEIEKGLTPQQKEIFGKYSQTLKRGMYDNVLKHEVRQAKEFQDETYKNLIGTSLDTAGTSYRDGTLVGMQTGIAIDALRKRPEYMGASADVKASMEKDLESAFHVQVVESALANNDVAYANEYFKSVSKGIPLKIRSKLEKELKPATDFDEGRTLALEVQGKIATGEMTPVQGERYLMEKAKTKESFAVAESMMREAQDAQKREAAKVSGSFVEKFELAPTRKTMNQIMADKQFQQMEPESRASLLKYFRQEIEQADDRYRARANEQTPEKFGQYLDVLNDPKFATMDPNEIRALQPKLGKDLTGKLLAAQKEAKGAAGRFQIDKDLLNEAIPKTLLQPQHKDQLNAFRGIVESNLQEWKLKNPGKVPTLEEQKAIARSANAEYIEIGKLWNSTLPAYEVKPEMKAVPKEFYEQSKAWAKQNGKSLSDEQILQAWQKQKGKK